VNEPREGEADSELSGPTSTGVDARLSALLCYLAWWVSGIVFLVIEQQHRGVRFHAAQSIVLFGGLSMLMIVMGIVTAGTLFVSPVAFEVVLRVSQLLGVAAVGLWLVLMLRIYKGEHWRVPFVADLAERISGK
jgi:uncharacterized membrane protein